MQRRGNDLYRIDEVERARPRHTLVNILPECVPGR
jgi:hypothetical protein